MCQNPKYILNPIIKNWKKNKNGFDSFEIDENSPSVSTSKFREKRVQMIDGKIVESYIDNYIDLSKFGIPGRYLKHYIKTPCGKCPECVQQRIGQLVSRCQIEFDISKVGYFVTLTYNDKNVPLDFVDDEPVMTLSKKDIQDFFKRLKINLGRAGYNDKFSYFYTSEYGMRETDNKRPHYHFMMFPKCDVSVDILGDFINEAWFKGFVEISPIIDKQIHYICTSHATSNKLFPLTAGQLTPFSGWSRGFGEPTEDHKKYIRQNNSVNVAKSSLIPDRYVLSKVYSDHDRKQLATIRNVVSVPRSDYYNQLEKYSRAKYNKSVTSLTNSQLDFIEKSIANDNKVKYDMMIKRQVLKR